MLRSNRKASTATYLGLANSADDERVSVCSERPGYAEDVAQGASALSDLDLLNIRTSAFEIYSVVAALFAGSAWHAVLLAGESKFVEGAEIWIFSGRALEMLHITIMSVVSAAGVYTTLIFAVSSIYTKTALAHGKVAAAYGFLSDSQYFRDVGFKAFVVICLAFPTDMVCLVFANIMINDNHIVLAIACCIPVAFLTVLTSWHVFQLFTKAGDHIFKPETDENDSVDPASGRDSLTSQRASTTTLP